MPSSPPPPTPSQPGGGVTGRRGGAHRPRGGGLDSPQVGPRRLHRVRRGRGHRPLRDPGPGGHPRPLQPQGEHRRPVVRLHHRRGRPRRRPSRPRTRRAGRERLGGHRHQRLPLRPGDALCDGRGQVGDLRVRQPRARGLRTRLHRRVRAEERLGDAARRPAVRLGLVRQRRRVHPGHGGHGRHGCSARWVWRAPSPTSPAPTPILRGCTRPSPIYNTAEDVAGRLVRLRSRRERHRS